MAIGSRRTTPTCAGGGGGGLRAHGRAEEDAVGPVAALEDQRRHARAAAAEDDRRDRHALRVFPARRHRRALPRGDGEARVRVRGLAGAVPGLALPVDEVRGRVLVLAFPPRARRRGVTATLVKIVSRAIVASAFGFVSGPGARHDAEEAGLRVDGPEPSVGAGPQPGDVVADGPHLPALRPRAARPAWRGWSCRRRRGRRRRRSGRSPPGSSSPGSACARPASPGRAPCVRRCAARSTSCRAARCRRSPSRRSRSRAPRGSGR